MAVQINLESGVRDQRKQLRVESESQLNEKRGGDAWY